MNKIIIAILCLTSVFMHSCKKEVVDPTPQNEPTSATLPAGFEAWKNIFDGEGVGAIYGHHGATFIFSKSGTKYAWFENEQILGIRNLKAANSHFKNLPLATVGAMGKLGSIYSSKIMVYNEAGTRYTVITPKNYHEELAFSDTEYFSFSTNTYTPYDMWVDGSYPFNDVDAIMADHKTVRFPYQITLYFAKKGGTEYCYVANSDNPLFSRGFGTNEFKMPNWGNNAAPVPMNMTSIGAMSIINLNTQTSYKIFFTEDGKQFKIWNEFDAAPSPLYSLY